MEFHNVDNFINDMAYKIKSIELNSNSVGQQLVGLMVDPPKRGRESDSTVDQYEEEYDYIFNGLKDRAKLITDVFNESQGITCNGIQGAMYAYPKIDLPKKAIAEAERLGQKPDFFYCMHMLNETGIMSVPGSGFGQVEGTNHFRITNLVCPTERMKDTMKQFTEFNNKFFKEFS